MTSKAVKSELNGVEEDGKVTLSSDEKVEKNELEIPYNVQLKWERIAIHVVIHFVAVYGVHAMFSFAKIATLIFAVILYHLSIFGVTAGSHRLWAHRSYKATWQLRSILILFHTMAFQGHVIAWARDHRVHHKYSDTIADPYSASRGFFFSHIGWMLCRKHPRVIEKGNEIDTSDLHADPILRFQMKYYMRLVALFCYILPTMIPVYFWNESWINAFLISANLRWLSAFHMTLCINSVAHKFGKRPYTDEFLARENKILSMATLGEGWHNYHHSFPWDYKAAELGNYSLNFTAAFIDFFAMLGWAYDLKTVSSDMIKARVQRAGDGSHERWSSNVQNSVKEL